MSTRASAPRCASCGMPLAPDAESCAVCGARVPLIARPASGDDDAVLDEDAPRGVGLAPSAAPPPTGVGGAPRPADQHRGPAPHRGSAPSAGAVAAGPSRAAAFDAAAASREVREAARPARREPSRTTETVPSVALRVLGHSIDVLAATGAAGAGLLVVQATGDGMAALPAVLGLLVAVAQVVAEGLGGATLGARLLGLRTVDERTGAVPGVWRAFVRQLVLGLGTLGCLVGYWVVAASGVWDSGPRRRGWHDKASGTAVVHAVAQTSAAVRPSRPPVGGGSSGDSRPWTPTPPPDVRAPAARATEQDPGRALDDFFAPPAATSHAVLPPPPSSTPGPPAAPLPDLLPVAPAGSGSPSPAPGRPEADLLPPPPGATRRTRAASPSVVPEPHPQDDDLAELEHTRVRDPESLRRRTGTLALHFDTGERVRVVGRGLVGRGPRAEDGQDILHVIVLNDGARSLSRVHAEFGPQPATADEDSAIWVSDRGSTNGTVVVDPTGAARVLPAGARALLGAGWTVRLGDREARVEAD